MKHLVVSLSGGKDSTAMLLTLLNSGCTDFETVFCDTTVEWPQMYEHLEMVERKTGVKITRLKPDHDYEYYLCEYKRTKGRLKGVRGYSFALPGSRWCTSLFKRDALNRYLSTKYGSRKNVCVAIGIAADETSRINHELLDQGLVKYPLIEAGITESQALEMCYKAGFHWDDLYTRFKRVSCWCCPLQSLDDLKVLYKEYPMLWLKLKEQQRRTFKPFRRDYTLDGLEMLFKSECESFKVK